MVKTRALHHGSNTYDLTSSYFLLELPELDILVGTSTDQRLPILPNVKRPDGSTVCFDRLNQG